MMNSYITQITDYLHALTLRERLLVLAVTCALIYLLTDSLLLSSHHEQAKAYSQKQIEIQQQQQSLAKEIEQNIALLEQEKEKKNQTEQHIADIKQQLADVTQKLDAQLNTLVPPTQVTELLRSLLSHTTNLKIVALNNENVREIELNSNQNNAVNTEAAKLYEHATIIELTGEYQQLYNYLQALENSQWQLLWDTLHYQVVEYPKARITIRVRTISTDEYWLGL